jgi:hypothetical protein
MTRKKTASSLISEMNLGIQHMTPTLLLNYVQLRNLKKLVLFQMAQTILMK